MRELTEYEKNKWGEGYDFGMSEDVLLMDGDELGDAFATTLAITHMRDYGLSNEFVNHAITTVLDMYYDQIFILFGEYGGGYTVDELGLPSSEETHTKGLELGLNDEDYLPDFGQIYTDERLMRLWDWAMEWRDEHMEETLRKRRLTHAEHEISILRVEEDGS